MLPIIAGLLKAGLPLLANAALAKGTEYLEEKTGIKLDPQAEPDSTQLSALRTIEAEQRPELERIKLENNRLDAEVEKAYLADVASARTHDTAVATSAEAPLLNKIIVPVLALLVVIGGGAIMVLSENADVRMAANSMVMVVLGFYYGTSMGSVKSSQMLRDMARNGKP